MNRTPSLSCLACAIAAIAAAWPAASSLAQTVTAEQTASAAIAQIKAPAAYALGATGRGVTVAVMDTGLDVNHPEFRNSGRVLAGLNTTGIGATTAVADLRGHGTHVAGLIAASRNGSGMMGVAYEATLLPVKVLRDTGAGTTAMVDLGLKGVIGKAQIVNMSLGSTTAPATTVLRSAVDSGLLIVAAAGNAAKANPDWPARFAKEAWARNQIIAVGAVDARNVIAPFSNRAGDTAAWFVVAPGVALTSSYLGGRYAMMSGTSMATPVVSGAAALIKSRWSNLRADQIANILFVTATDLGAKGIDPIYGRGLINVEAAMKPVGSITTTTVSGRTVSVIDSRLAPTPAVGGVWGLAVGGALQVVGFDEFGRDFATDLGAKVQRQSALSFNTLLARTDRRLVAAEQVLADGSRWMAAYDRPADVAPKSALHPAAASLDDRLLAFSLAQTDVTGREWAAGLGLADRWFGLQGTAEGAALRGITSLSQPFLALVPHAGYIGSALPLAGGQLKAGWLSSALQPALTGQYGIAQGAAGITDGSRSSATVLEYSRRVGAVALSAGWSQTQEQGRFLGAQSAGALALGSQALSSAVTLGAAWQPAPGWALAGQWSAGRTPGWQNADSLITSASMQRTQAWTLALAGDSRWVAQDRLTLSLSQPLRAVGGSLTIDRGVALDDEGAVQREQSTRSLVPAGRELLAELSYGRPFALPMIDGAGWLDATLALRRQAGHLADAGTDTALMLRWQSRW